MDILKILKAIEELVTEIALWMILIPKTAIRLVRKPTWAHSYVTQESSKDPSEQFDQFMSPVLFFLLTGVIPFLVVRKQFFFMNHVGRLTFSEQLVESAVFLLSGPLSFAFVVLVVQRKAIGRVSIKLQFRIQCYCFSMAFFFLATGVAVFALFDNLSETVRNFLFALFLGWLIYSELSVLHKEFNGNWFEIIRSAFLGFVFWPVLLLLAIGITDLYFRGPFTNDIK